MFVKTNYKTKIYCNLEELYVMLVNFEEKSALDPRYLNLDTRQF